LQDSSGIFWDNDSLSALLALELKADLLILLSDVDGLYNGPPSDPHSKLIHTYIKEKHQNEITFGDKSRVGRGGMTAKVKASVHAADAGIPVVITRCIAVLFSFLKNTIFESIFISPLQILFNEFLGPVCYGIIKKWLFLRKA
jgi:glutamate 5-kinase